MPPYQKVVPLHFENNIFMTKKQAIQLFEERREVIKHRLKKEHNLSVTNCNQLKTSPKAGGTQTVTNSHGLKMDMLQIEKK